MSINKVLIVDDSAAELTSLKKIISDAGCIVISASNGKEAVDLAKVERPDLIFMDIIMPEMDGYEATRRLSNDFSTKHIPIIFVSSKGQKADKLWGQMQGGRGYITKPYTPDQVLQHMKAFQ